MRQGNTKAKTLADGSYGLRRVDVVLVAALAPAIIVARRVVRRAKRR